METILINYSYQEKPIATKRVIFLGMLFVNFLIVSHLTAGR
jgi:hypothetical protein